MGVNVPTPSALQTGDRVRADLTDEERTALLTAARRFRGVDLIEIADALGLTGERPVAAYVAGSFVSSAFGSQGAASR